MCASVGIDTTPSVLMTVPVTASRPPPNVIFPLRAADSHDVVTVKGLRHARIRLDPRHYKSSTFARQVLEIIHVLSLPSWVKAETVSEGVKIQKVSGSLTNAVFFVSYPSKPYIRTLLLRVYGVSSGSLISRPREIRILHTLSSQYDIGPRVYGTFENGRFEEHFDSNALSSSDLRDRQISRWIGARMAELHQVDIDAIERSSARHHEDSAIKNIKSWMLPAQAVLALPTVKPSARASINLDAFRVQWDKYMRWLSDVERREGPCRRVFAHNDTQCGNLLRLAKRENGAPDHRQIIVVDFEYSAPNPAAFDIANHFHEWTANYHSHAPHILDQSKYPTLEERRNFYSAYIAHSYPTLPDGEKHKMMDIMDFQVRLWSPASHAMWAIWGIVQAREDLEGAKGVEPEFDYIGYAQCRIDAFRKEIRDLG